MNPLADSRPPGPLLHLRTTVPVLAFAGMLAVTAGAGIRTAGGQDDATFPVPQPLILPATAERIVAHRSSHWAFQPITDPHLPVVGSPRWPANGIDHFILARLEAAGLAPAPEADRRTLIRRLSFDLRGLPPAPAEVDAFLADESPNAWDALVDRFLASPEYGEQWGRHWLDVVRYADTAGCSSDYPVPDLHRYRDYVIDAFNRDLPFDRFVAEQLAGDLIPVAHEADRVRGIVATGYLALSRRFGVSGREMPLTIEDTIDNLGQAFLGLSIGCARCHDHTHDALSTADYYALYGIFASSRYSFPGAETDKEPSGLIPIGGPAQRDRFLALQRELDALRDEAARLLEQQTEPMSTQGAGQAVSGSTGDPIRARHAEIAAARKAILDRLAMLPSAHGVVDGDRAADAAIQIGGDPGREGPVVPRRFPEVLGGMPVPAGHLGSGREMLARWITSPRNPLTPRVVVNRIWAHHFASGLVTTPNDLGTHGEPPSHPELLDYLARRFIDGGWSFKRLHRLILTSSTWRQACVENADARRKDPGNALLWSFPRRRLQAEEIVDAILDVSGTLEPGTGGPHPFPSPSRFDFTQHTPFAAAFASDRRAIYWMRTRLQDHPILTLFDGADPKASTGWRATSTTSLQALFHLNSEFVDAKAHATARRLMRETADDAGAIAHLHALAFARAPTAEEVTRGLDFLATARSILVEGGVGGADVADDALAAYVRAVLATNEFLFVE